MEAPAFVRLVGHPIRWQLLTELVHSDRAVRELTELVGEPQNLVSYHLRQLRDGGLVSSHRSAADGRDSYYSIDLTRCRDELQAAGRALHPALWLVPAAAPVTAHKRVLFLCTGNSARSEMAEALIVQMSGGRVDAVSAGSNPKALHAHAVKVMHKRSIDISENRTKHLDEFTAQRFDVVVTLCDRVREVCPEFPRQPRLVHWSIPDPALDGSIKAFERTATELETRIGFMLPQLNAGRSRNE
jgi:protein-tyrosine-phosphatase/DNA-binding transcriptional ArsR family regulator